MQISKQWYSIRQCQKLWENDVNQILSKSHKIGTIIHPSRRYDISIIYLDIYTYQRLKAAWIPLNSSQKRDHKRSISLSFPSRYEQLGTETHSCSNRLKRSKSNSKSTTIKLRRADISGFSLTHRRISGFGSTLVLAFLLLESDDSDDAARKLQLILKITSLILFLLKASLEGNPEEFIGGKIYIRWYIKDCLYVNL